VATGPECVVQIAEATGLPFVTVDTVARVLKQAKPPLWARSVQGDRLARRSEQAEPVHLFNLALGLAVADPFTRAVEAVTFWRSLVPDPSRLPAPRLSNPERLVLGLIDEEKANLGVVGERLIALAADAADDDDVDQRTMAILRAAAVQLELRLGAHPRVFIHVRFHPDLLNRKPPTQILFRPPEAPVDAEFLPPDAAAPIIRSATLTMELFDVLGGLWANSRQRLAEITPMQQGTTT
jgi:hypothetical protein